MVVFRRLAIETLAGNQYQLPAIPLKPVAVTPLLYSKKRAQQGGEGRGGAVCWQSAQQRKGFKATPGSSVGQGELELQGNQGPAQQRERRGWGQEQHGLQGHQESLRTNEEQRGRKRSAGESRPMKPLAASPVFFLLITLEWRGSPRHVSPSVHPVTKLPDFSAPPILQAARVPPNTDLNTSDPETHENAQLQSQLEECKLELQIYHFSNLSDDPNDR